MKSRFIKQLEKKQKIFMLVNEGNNGNNGMCFFFRGFDIPIKNISEDDYLALQKDSEFAMRLLEIGALLGMSVHLSYRNIAISAYFKGEGFWCCEKYYGKLMYEICKHLQWCLGRDLLLDINSPLIALSPFKKGKHKRITEGK